MIMRYEPPPQQNEFNWIWQKWIYGLWAYIDKFTSIYSAKGPSSATLLSGEISISEAFFISVDTEGGSAADDCDIINGAITGQRLIIKSTDSLRVVNIKHGTGNIRLSGGVDFTLSNPRFKIELIYDSGEWHEISRSENT